MFIINTLAALLCLTDLYLYFFDDEFMQEMHKEMSGLAVTFILVVELVVVYIWIWGILL